VGADNAAALHLASDKTRLRQKAVEMRLEPGQVNFDLVENPRSQVCDDMLSYGMRGNLFEYYMPIFRHRLEELDTESPLHLDACERTGACQPKKTDLMGESSA